MLPSSKDTKYVLLFDGLDQLPRDEADRLFSAIAAPTSSTVRILVTGTEDLQDSLNASAESIDRASNIQVSEYNQSDIKCFVDRETATCKALQGNVPDIKEILNSIKAKTPDIVDGNFINVRHLIATINRAVESELSQEEILGLISVDTLEDDDDHATKRLIGELNRSLSAPEIEQLNELLAWTIYASWWLGADAMLAALFLCTERKLRQSLEDKVAHKYFELLRIKPDGTFIMSNQNLEDFFREEKRSDNHMNNGNESRISMTITINRATAPQVRNFVWKLGEKVVFDQIPFEQALIGSDQRTIIRANSTDAHLVLTKKCLEVLSEDPKDDIKALSPYAVENVMAHISDLRNDTESFPLDIVERENILAYLVCVLQSADIVEKHLTEPFFEEGACLDYPRDLESIRAWICDRQAMDKLLDKTRINWIKRVKERGSLAALEGIAMMLARQWLHSRSWPAQLPFHWIDEYLNRLSEQENDESLKATFPRENNL